MGFTVQEILYLHTASMGKSELMTLLVLLPYVLYIDNCSRKPQGLLKVSTDLHCMLLVDALLDFGNCLSWIEALGADFCAIHDGVTPIQLIGVIQLSKPLLGEVVSAVNHPSAVPKFFCLQILQEKSKLTPSDRKVLVNFRWLAKSAVAKGRV